VAGCSSPPPTTDCAIREALTLAASTPGTDTIVIAAGITINLTLGELLLDSDLIIQGNNATIRRSSAAGTPAFRIMTVSTTNAEIYNLTISNGLANNGAIANGGNAGGILVPEGATLALFGCDFIGNTATQGGGVYNAGTLKLNGSRLSNNLAIGTGGGIFVASNATLETYSSSAISSNTALNRGGGINNEGGTVKLNGARQ
jgi:hypothetical protein